MIHIDIFELVILKSFNFGQSSSYLQIKIKYQERSIFFNSVT